MSDLCIIPKLALADERLTSADIRVLCAIGIHTDGAGEGAWANARTFSAEGGISRSQFFVSAKRLLELGYIRRASRQGRSSVYRIVLDHKSVGVIRRKHLHSESPESGLKARESRIWTGESSPLDGTRPDVLDGSTINAPSNAPQSVTTGGSVKGRARRAVALEGLRRSRVLQDLQGFEVPDVMAIKAVPMTPEEKAGWRKTLRSVGAGPHEESRLRESA